MSQLTSLTHGIIVAQDKFTVLKTVSFPEKSLAQCVENIF
jgi:hypothetical protein